MAFYLFTVGATLLIVLLFSFLIYTTYDLYREAEGSAKILAGAAILSVILMIAGLILSKIG